jgi:RHS repeat-associated protein
LAWTASSGATSYGILRSLTGGAGTYSSVGSTASTSYTDSGIADGTTYYYEVTASNTHGTSGPSNSAAALTIPPVPAGLVATPSTTALQVSLSWSASQSATSYIVLDSMTANGTYASVGATGSTSFTATNLIAGTTYYFEVEAENASGISPGCSPASALTIPPAPTGLAVQSAPSQGSLNLAWNASQSATSYTVLDSGTSGGSYTPCGSSSSTSYTVTGLADGTTYYFEVKAQNATGFSTTSSSVAGLTLPGQPQNFAYTLVNGVPVFTWSPVQSATSYIGGRKFNNQTDSLVFLGPFTSTTFTDSPGAGDWLYEVQAQNATGQGPMSWLEVILGMTAPVLTATGSNNLVTLSWTSPSGATTFNLSKSNSYSGPYGVIYSGSNTGYSDSNVTNGSTYYYQVIAYTSKGFASPPSNIASATPGAPVIQTTPIQVQPVTGSTGGSGGGGYTTTPLTLPAWAESTIPFDHSAGSGGGPSSTFGVSLPYGVLESDCGPDLVVQNPIGPDAIFERTYRTALANAGISSDGLPAGWVNNWDYRIYRANPSGWGNLLLVYPSGGSDVLVPTMQQQDDGSYYPTGAFTAPANAPYTLSGTPDPDNAGNWTSIVFKTGYNANETFSPEGSTFRPTQSVTEDGQQLNIQYDSNNRFSQIQDANLNPLLEATYNGSGQLISVVDATADEPTGNRTVTYNYASSTLGSTLTSSSLVTVSGSPTIAWQYSYTTVGSASYLNNVATYNGTGLLSSTATFDGDGRVVALADADGNTRNYTYNATSTTVATGGQSGSFESWNQAFDGNGRNTGGTNAAGGTSTISYGTVLQTPASVQGPHEDAQQIQADQFGNVTQYTDAHGCKYVISYDNPPSPFERVTSVQEFGVDGTPRTPTSFTYDSSGHIASVTCPAAGATGGNGPTIEIDYVYDAKGNLTSISEPSASGTATYTYNYTADGSYTQAEVLGEPLTLTDPIGNVTHYRYDPLGHLTTMKDPVGNTTSLAYNDVDDLAQATFPNGDYVTPTYTNLGKPPTATTLHGYSGGSVSDTTTFSGEFVANGVSGTALTENAAYNPENLLNSIKNGNGQSIHNFLYNPSNNGAPNSQFSNTSFSNPPSGQKIWTTNYDNSYSAISGTDPDGNSTSISRGLGDNRVTGTTTTGNSAELDTNYTYDVFGRVASVSDGTGNSLAYTYDDADNVLTVTTNGLNYAFNGNTVTYTYYPNGERKSMYFVAALHGAPSGQEYTYNYTYNDAGQMTNVAIYAGSTNGQGGTATDANATYYYDGNGRVIRMATPYSDVFYTYDTEGRVTELDNLYPLPVGANYPKITGPNGPGPEGVIAYYSSMQYDISGNRTGENYQIPPCGDYSGYASFGYDGQNELTSESYVFNNFPALTFSHAYDQAGNPVTIRGNPVTIDPTQDLMTGLVVSNLSPNQVDEDVDGTYSIGYDANGNVNSASSPGNGGPSYSRQFAFDQADRLSTISGTGAPSNPTPITYLPNNLRIARSTVSGDASYSYLYDGSAVIGTAYFSSGFDTPSQSGLYLWGPTGVAMCYDSGGSVAFLYDPAGNRVCASNANTTSGCIQFWDAYGDTYNFDADFPTLDTGADNQFILDQICYKGQEGSVYDWDAGMLYCQNRYYIGNGRWLTRDPLGLDGGLNVYEFCGNNPLMGADPSGLDWDWGQYWHDVGEMFKGYGDAIVGTAKGLWRYNMLNPDGVINTIHDVTHPAQMYRGLKSAVREFGANISGSNGVRGFGKGWGDLSIIAATFGAGSAESELGVAAGAYSKLPYTSVNEATGIPMWNDIADFDEVAIKDVHIEPSGKYHLDFKRANEAAGLAEKPKGFSWHHHHELGRMQLVPRAIHEATIHRGGWAIWGRLWGK